MIKKCFECDICNCGDKDDCKVIEYMPSDGTINLLSTDIGQLGDKVFCESCLYELGQALLKAGYAKQVP